MKAEVIAVAFVVGWIALLVAGAGIAELAAAWMGWSRRQRDARNRNRQHVHR